MSPCFLLGLGTGCVGRVGCVYQVPGAEGMDPGQHCKNLLHVESGCPSLQFMVLMKTVPFVELVSTLLLFW